VADDLTYVSPSIASLIVDDALDGTRAGQGPAQRTLSPREREVLQLLAEGRSSKDIAARLDVAVPTVETHRRQIMDKLGLRTIAELTKYAIREGLTPLD
jgi:DNA-binding NarL/FixJ family response regulator